MRDGQVVKPIEDDAASTIQDTILIKHKLGDK